MTRTPPKSVSIAAEHNKPDLSKGQKAFNTLIKQIEKRRTRLSSWEARAPAFHQKYVNELLPLEQAATDLKVRLVHCLDRASSQKGLTQSDRRTIASLVTELAGDLVADRDDAELKSIYNKYSQSDYDSEAAAEMEDMKSALEAMLGVELGDDLDMSSPEEVLQRARANMEQRQAEYAAESRAREERQAKRKKTAKQIAAEVRQQAEQAQLSQSIREIYRKLASALHPDRETNPQERDRKTELMQRVNQAYSKNNLLQLLELQLELEHIDQNALNGISEDRLKHYNKILKEQLSELDHEILHVETDFKLRYGIAPFRDVSPDNALGNLARAVVNMQQTVRAIEKDLRAFDDVTTIKAWLKGMRRQEAMPRMDFMPY
jgi:hypothetical protein